MIKAIESEKTVIFRACGSPRPASALRIYPDCGCGSLLVRDMTNIDRLRAAQGREKDAP